MPFKVWAIGEEVLAADFNDYVQEQVVATFPTVAARDQAIAAPNEGQLCYVVATKTVYIWNGAAWSTLGAGGLRVVAETVRTANAPAIGVTYTQIHSASVNVVAGRAYYLRYAAGVGSSVATGMFHGYQARLGSVTGTQLAAATFISNAVAVLWEEFLVPLVGMPPGLQTIVLAANATTGTMTVNGSATAPGLFQILDRDTSPIS